jgi:hypothetical protein
MPSAEGNKINHQNTGPIFVVASFLGINFTEFENIFLYLIGFFAVLDLIRSGFSVSCIYKFHLAV